MSATRTATDRVRALCGATYPRSRATASMRRRVSSLTRSGFERARETVEVATPTRAATIAIVGPAICSANHSWQNLANNCQSLPRGLSVGRMTSARWLLSGFGDEIDADPVVQVAALQALGASNIEVRSAWGINIVELSDDQLAQLK